MPPWITTRALEQANDTKELNRVQRPLPGGGKVVDNSVDPSVPFRHGSRPSRIARSGPVDAAPPGLAPSTGYRRVFPRRPSIVDTPCAAVTRRRVPACRGHSYAAAPGSGGEHRGGMAGACPCPGRGGASIL